MEREKKVFLCVQSLLNISKDLRNEYEEYTNMLLFIADKIAEAEQKRDKVDETYVLHGDGRVHDLSSCDKKEECEFVLPEEQCTCGPGEACNLCTEDMSIEKEIDEMISTVRKEMNSVSD